MDDLISREDALAQMREYYDDCAVTSEYTRLGFETAMEVIKTIPSAFEGMTNGKVMKAVFPNMKVHEYTEKVVLNGLGDEFQIQSMAWKNWWNAPYKGVSE